MYRDPSSSFRKMLTLGCLVWATTLPARAQMTGQIINCDSPHPTQPQFCVDNWALDVLDEPKTALEQATGSLPRDRKHYFERTGTGVHIFLIDTGVDLQNPDFKTLGNQALSRIGSNFRSTADRDAGSHGSRVAGLAAGLQFGVAKGATIHPIYKGSPSQPSFVLDGLNWVYEQVVTNGLRPAVVNMSFNIPRPVVETAVPKWDIEADLDKKVRDLIAAGVVVVVSAGNKNDNPGAYWPSSIPEVIVVGGVDENGNRWVRDTTDPDYNNICLNPAVRDCGSNFGGLVDIWAPAKYIRSAVKTTNDDNLAPRVRSGTSFAAPMVTGLVALYLQQFPTHTPAQVLAGLRANAANLGDIDRNGSADFLARSPVATPACNIPQRLFVNAGKSVQFLATELADSCPTGYSAYSQFNATNGQITVDGVAPEDVLYRYTPLASFVLGNDQFNYSIFDSTGAAFGAGTVKVMVQPNYN